MPFNLVATDNSSKIHLVGVRLRIDHELACRNVLWDGEVRLSERRLSQSCERSWTIASTWNVGGSYLTKIRTGVESPSITAIRTVIANEGSSTQTSPDNLVQTQRTAEDVTSGPSSFPSGLCVCVSNL
jgi:hypothetical protein